MLTVLLCVSRKLFRMNLVLDVRRMLCSLRQVMDYVEVFVLCLQVHRGG